LQGERVALIEAERSFSYAQLDERCARCAGWLRELGVRRGDRVAFSLANRAAALETVFAAARIGAVAVPINTRLAPPEIRHQLDDSEPRVLLHEASLEGAVAKACQGAKAALEQLAVGGEPDAYEARLAASTPAFAVERVSPEDPVILMYTSGTTGTPKGALLPHRKTLFNALNAQIFFDLCARDRVLVVVPLFHSYGLKILSLPALYAGATVVLQRRFDPGAVWQAVDEHGITYFGGVPTMFRDLLETLEGAPAGRYPLDSLRFLFTAGAAVPVELIHAFERRGLVLKQGFGQTETSILLCLDDRDAVRKAGSVGRSVFHAEVRVVTRNSLQGPPEAWQDVSPGEEGEIVVRGPITMLGYWRLPELTAETLREGWVCTGDLAKLDEEGFVTLVGRARDMYISGGENVYPAQVEAVYAEHPSVREVAVVGIPDERWGETGCAYLVPEPGQAIEAETLRAWGRQRLAIFKVPSRFVAVEALPRTASGKVQKYKLGP
jgi:fatty-acyl-CoA synthase